MAVSAFLAVLAVTGLVQSRPHRVVIEVNVSGTLAYGTVLNNATNLIKAFAPEKVQIEIVCHGSGIDMLFPAARIADQLKKAQVLGVGFAACANTMRGRKLAKKDLFPFVEVVDSGVAEVVRKQEAGWSYLKGRLLVIRNPNLAVVDNHVARTDSSPGGRRALRLSRFVSV